MGKVSQSESPVVTRYKVVIVVTEDC